MLQLRLFVGVCVLVVVALGEVAIHPTVEIACCACKVYSKSDHCRSGTCESSSRSSIGVFTHHGFCWDPVAMNHNRHHKSVLATACSDITLDCDGKDKFEHSKKLRGFTPTFTPKLPTADSPA
jgi:hypothetical protein